uniref:Uncharacterized protein n=1 Tax=viral metagenome TaxID=1070528 RepID=A0A6C0KMR7_9ZZZZ
MAPHEGYHEAAGPAPIHPPAPSGPARGRFAELANDAGKARKVVAGLGDAEPREYEFQQIGKFVDGVNVFVKNLGFVGLNEDQAQAVKQNVSYTATFINAARRSATDAVTAQPNGW